MLMAAGALAFFAFLAIPSAFSALVALYGLAFNPSRVAQQVAALAGFMPREAATLIGSQLKSITATSPSRLGIAFAASLAVALWSARSGTASLMSALDMAYEEEEKRSLIRFELEALSTSSLILRHNPSNNSVMLTGSPSSSRFEIIVLGYARRLAACTGWLDRVRTHPAPSTSHNLRSPR
jgi:hypothetical protein